MSKVTASVARIPCPHSYLRTINSRRLWRRPHQRTRDITRWVRFRVPWIQIKSIIRFSPYAPPLIWGSFFLTHFGKLSHLVNTICSSVLCSFRSQMTKKRGGLFSCLWVVKFRHSLTLLFPPLPPRPLWGKMPPLPETCLPFTALIPRLQERTAKMC